MKIFKNSFLVLSLVSVLFTSCDKIFDVDSEQFVKTDDLSVNSNSDTVRTLVGVFSQMQTLAERYVLFGELRADLMDINSKASLDLQQIANNEISSNNIYNNKKDYYKVINNCNFLISKIDTGVVTGGFKMMLREYAAAKTIRAWTYLQLVLNYDTVVYYTNPILSTDDIKKDYPKYNLNTLAPVLISDLLPYVDVETPLYGTFGEVYANDFFIPVRFLLGELYLWTGDYENAAIQYHDLLYKETTLTNFSGSVFNSQGVPVPYNWRNRWNVVNGVFKTIYNTYKFNLQTTDIYSYLGTTYEFEGGSHLLLYTFPSENYTDFSDIVLKPSNVALSNWDNAVYYDANSANFIKGDLRGYDNAYYNASSFNRVEDLTTSKSSPGMENYITKYAILGSFTNKYEYIITSRGCLTYLRYAEAVNRLGKPNLAFAVLKYGLNNLNLKNTNIVPKSETGDIAPGYMDFSKADFVQNIGIHARGCGYTETAGNYKIPALADLGDSVKYVEDLIIKELALENAFEGNRFYDLMRVSLRRDDPTYLANIIAEKYSDKKESIKSKLSDPKNWYLK